MSLPRQKLLVRTALALARRRFAAQPTTDLPIAAWQECLRGAWLLEETERRDWRAAHVECRGRLYRELCDLRCQLDAVFHELREPPASTPATAREIYEDLAALETEYPALRIDLKERELAVATEPIVLEGVRLGSFEIVVQWPARRGALDYRVVALDPNPAGRNEDVTHPHVSDEKLCEGEGRAAIRRCLASGRLWDFFAVVSRTLASYNPSSAFVMLEEWDGRSCSRCGDSPRGDDLSSCQRCDCDLCDECSCSCGACGNTVCDDCSAPCRGCGDNYCGACLQTCRTCREHFCEECLDEGICNRCCEAADEGGGEHGGDPVAAPAAAPAEAVALRVGQTCLPA